MWLRDDLNDCFTYFKLSELAIVRTPILITDLLMIVRRLAKGFSSSIDRFFDVSQNVSRNRQQGFTLLELIVTMGIAAIVMVIALPSLQSVVNNGRISSARDGVANAIKMARSEAVYSKIPTTICASADQQSCSGTGDWDNGWIVFNDADADGELDAGDVLVDVFYGSGAVTIGAGSGGGTITFQSSGVKTNVAVDSIGFCDPNAELHGKSLSVGATGSLRYLGDGAAGC